MEEKKWFTREVEKLNWVRITAFRPGKSQIPILVRGSTRVCLNEPIFCKPANMLHETPYGVEDKIVIDFYAVISFGWSEYYPLNGVFIGSWYSVYEGKTIPRKDYNPDKGIKRSTIDSNIFGTFTAEKARLFLVDSDENKHFETDDIIEWVHIL